MGSIVNKTSGDISGNMQSDVEPLRRLWLEVAHIALCDAAAEVSKARRFGNGEAEISAQMYYFRRKHWQEVCEMAGISYRPDRIEEFLRSDDIGKHAQKTRANVWRRMGWAEMEDTHD